MGILIKCKNKAVPALTLFLLSPVIAEIVVGSIPVSRFLEFAEAIGLYGSGALLTREMSLKLKVGWLSVAGLGLAFGIIEEALSLQSVFNPSFFGLDISFGRALDVNWVWAVFIVSYHALFSITIPICIAELMFYKEKKRPWLNKWAVLAMVFCYLFMIAHYHYRFYDLTNFETTITHFVSAAILAALVILVSTRLRVHWKIKFLQPGQSSIGLLSFILMLIWFALFTTVFIENSRISPWLIAITGISVMVVLSILTNSLSEKRPLPGVQCINVITGCVSAQALYGVLVLSESNCMWDRIGQVLVSALLVTLLFRLKHTWLSHLNKS